MSPADSAPRIGEASDPRFEFRSFGQDLDAVRFQLGRLSAPVPDAVRERRSDETYIVSRTTDRCNTKVRAGKIDVKWLLQAVERFEQWDAVLKTPFPLPTTLLRDAVFPAMNVSAPTLATDSYDVEQLIALVRAHPDLAAVAVHKQRFGYLVHDVTCEYAVVHVNGARVVTVGAESTDLEALRRVVAETGMAGLEPINYLQATKRVIGMVPMPIPHR